MLRLSLVAVSSNMFPHCLRQLVPPAVWRFDFACEQRRAVALQARTSWSCYKNHLSRPCSMRLNTIQAASLPCSSNMCVRKRGTLPQDADSKVELQQQAWGGRHALEAPHRACHTAVHLRICRMLGSAAS